MAFAVLIIAALLAGPVALGAYLVAGFSLLGALALYSGLGTAAFVVVLVVSLSDTLSRRADPPLPMKG